METPDAGTLLVIAGMLAVAGGVTGVPAGLFGVGGGAITVPIPFKVSGLIGVPGAGRMPLAVGASLAIIIPTSIQSAHGHCQRGAVDMDLLQASALPVLLGVIAGSVIARFAQPWVVQSVFVLVAGTDAIKMLFRRDSWRLGDDLRGGALRRDFGRIVPTTLLPTRIGVRLAHTIPKRRLEVRFGPFLAAVCARSVILPIP